MKKHRHQYEGRKKSELGIFLANISSRTSSRALRRMVSLNLQVSTASEISREERLNAEAANILILLLNTTNS